LTGHHTATGDPAHQQAEGFQNLEPHNKTLATLVSKPRWVIYIAAAAIILLAWFWLVYLAAGISQNVGTVSLGPGMQLWNNLFGQFGQEAFQSPIMALVIQLCTPQPAQSFDAAGTAMVFSMWLLMSVAMMLPSAAPLMRTYAEISDVAAAKGERVVSLWVLVSGYLLVWAGFAGLATLGQAVLNGLGLISNTVLPVEGIVGAAVLLMAGAYQFTGLKEACLRKCRNPFTTLFARWTTQTRGVFRLGVEQGLFCLGCCWALMLVMLVVGTMNLTWMAFLTLFAIVEKSGGGKVTSRVTGGILLAWGGILFTLSVVQQ